MRCGVWGEFLENWFFVCEVILRVVNDIYVQYRFEKRRKCPGIIERICVFKTLFFIVYMCCL